MKFIQQTKLAAVLSLGITAMSGVAMAVPQELVDGLGDESYVNREKAEQDLTMWAKKNGEAGIGVLSELKKRARSPEVRSRLDNVISESSIYKAIPNTRGYMGVILMPELGAAFVDSVEPGTPASKAGLEAGDIIIEVDGIDLSKKNNDALEATAFLKRYVKTKKAGEKLSLKIKRGVQTFTKNLKLGNYDAELKQLGIQNEGIQIMPMQGNQRGGRMQIEIFPQGGKNRKLLLKDRQLELKKGNLNLKFEFRLNNKDQPQNKKELPPEIQEMLEKLNQQNMEQLKELEKKAK